MSSTMLILCFSAIITCLHFAGARYYNIGETGIIRCDDPRVLGNVQNLQHIQFKREGRVIHSVDIIRGKVYPSQQYVRFTSHVSLVRNSSVPFLEMRNLGVGDHAKFSCHLTFRDLSHLVVHHTLNVRHAAPAPMVQCDDTEVRHNRVTMTGDPKQLRCHCVSMGGWPAPTLGWYRDHVPMTGQQSTRQLSMSEESPLNGTLYTCKAEQEDILSFRDQYDQNTVQISKGNTVHTSAHTASTSLKVHIVQILLASSTTATTTTTLTTPSTSTTRAVETTSEMNNNPKTLALDIKSLTAEVRSQEENTLIKPIVIGCCVVVVLVFLSGLLVCVYRRKNISGSKAEMDGSYKQTFQCQTPRIDNNTNHNYSEASLMRKLTRKSSPSPPSSMSSCSCKYSPTASMSTCHGDGDTFDKMTPPLDSPV